MPPALALLVADPSKSRAAVLNGRARAAAIAKASAELDTDREVLPATSPKLSVSEAALEALKAEARVARVKERARLTAQLRTLDLSEVFRRAMMAHSLSRSPAADWT